MLVNDRAENFEADLFLHLNIKFTTLSLTMIIKQPLSVSPEGSGCFQKRMPVEMTMLL